MVTVHGRRVLLKAAAAGMAGGALAAPGRSAAADIDVGAPWVRGRRFLDTMMDAYADGDQLRLPQSYTDQVGLLTTAFTYDVALAILAYLSDGCDDALRRARLLGDALLYASAHDPELPGPLRQAYAVAPYTRGETVEKEGFIRADGTVNAGGPYRFTAAFTGDQAWVGLAFCALFRRTREKVYLTGAIRLARWVRDQAASGGRLGGFTLGLGRRGQALIGQSTTHNADLFAFFGRLETLTGRREWAAPRRAALDFVARTWVREECCFAAGSPDGDALDDGARTLEAQTHPWLALRDPRYAGALAFVDRELRVLDTPQRPNSELTGRQVFRGVTVSTLSPRVDPAKPIEEALPLPDPQAVWFEGTAQYAFAVGGGKAFRERRPITVAQRELGVGQTVGGRRVPVHSGVVAASSPLHVGFADSGYYPSRHVGATAWYVLAARGRNPLL